MSVATYPATSPIRHATKRVAIVRYKIEAVSLPPCIKPLVIDEPSGRILRYTGMRRRQVVQLTGHMPDGPVTATYTVEIEEVPAAW